LSRAAQNRKITAALIAVIMLMMGLTFLRADTPRTRRLTSVTTQTIAAFQMTKIAYCLRNASDRHTAASLQESAVHAWRGLAGSPDGRPADWRRLGITLFTFGRPGGMEAFRRAAEPTAEERTLWQAIYGREPITAGQAAALQATLTRLHLGWFENLAAAQLYTRAGRRAEASRAAARALASAQPVAAINRWEFLIVMVGLAGLLFVGLQWLSGRQPRLFATLGQKLPPFAVLPPAAVPHGAAGQAPDAPVAGMSPPPLSYQTRMIAFVTYLASPLAVSLPLLFLRPWLYRLPDVTVGRLTVALNLILYLPIVCLTLVVLSHLAASESPDRFRPTPRAMLAALGFRTENALADMGAGLLGYALITPLTVFAGALSAWLFQRFSTPVHPTMAQMALLQTPLDKCLLLLETAIAAPIVEEMMFRGLLYPAMRERWGRTRGILLSAAIFAIVHPTLPGQFLPLWTLGIGLTLAYERRGSLLPGIVMHGLNNSLVLFSTFAALAN
jgi:membrane protease YdiL (CAAX protease family)